jgi:hypothetical protein
MTLLGRRAHLPVGRAEVGRVIGRRPRGIDFASARVGAGTAPACDPDVLGVGPRAGHGRTGPSPARVAQARTSDARTHDRRPIAGPFTGGARSCCAHGGAHRFATAAPTGARRGAGVVLGADGGGAPGPQRDPELATGAPCGSDVRPSAVRPYAALGGATKDGIGMARFNSARDPVGSQIFASDSGLFAAW